jgi:hypothetical protein
MVTADGQIQFTLEPAAPLPRLDVRMRRFGERWVAEVGGDQPNVGIAVRPRDALAAALSPLGSTAVTLMLGDLSRLEPSCQIIELERDSVS